MAAYKPQIIKPTNHAEWLERRSKGIGASEIGKLLGLSHFGTPLSVWRQKVGLDGPEPENIAMMMGHLLEDVVAQRFAIETGYKIIKASAADIIYADPDKPYMRVTPDRIVKVGKEKHLLECKSTSMKVDENNIPYPWLCQVQYQMRVTGIHVCYLAWLINGRDFGYVKIDFDKEFSDYIEGVVTDFWTNNVLANVEPECITPEDVMAKYPASDPDSTIEADEEAKSDILELVRLNKIYKDAEGKIKALKSRIQVYLGEKEMLTSGNDILATWKTGKGRASFDSKAFATDHPDLYKQYYKEGKPSRTFLLKVSDE